MSVHTNFLTEAGLIKLPAPPFDISNCKMRLYFFSDQTLECVTNIQKIFQQKITEKIYDGLISEMLQDIQHKPYLFKEGNAFKLISKEKALQLQPFLSHSAQLKENIFQDTRSQQKNFSLLINGMNNPDQFIPLKTPEDKILFSLYGLYGREDIYSESEKFHKELLYYKKALKIALGLYEQGVEGRAYGNLGNIYAMLGKVHKACDYYEKALKIALEMQDQVVERMAYGNLGNTYEELGEYDKAIQYHEKALKIAIALQDQISEGRCYRNLGSAYLGLNKYQQAINHYEKALKIAIDLLDKAEEGIVYDNLGNAYKELGQYDKAIQYYEKVLEITIEVEDQITKGTCYSNLGSAYHKLGKHDKAIQYYEDALKIAIEFLDEAKEGTIYDNLGNVYRSSRKYDKAIQYYEDALEIAIELEDQAEEREVSCNLGSTYHKLVEYDKAIQHYERALEIAIELKDQIEERRVYCNLGNIYDELGKYDKAIQYYEEALEIAMELQDQVWEGGSYSNLGIIYNELGEYDQALHYHEKALRIAIELQDEAGKGRAYINLGNVYYCLGDHLKAIDNQEMSLDIAIKLQDQVGEGLIYGNLGNAYSGLSEYQQAINYHEKDLKIALGLQDRIGQGRAYSNLGNVYLGLGEYHEAINYYEKVLKIALNLQIKATEGKAYHSLGHAYGALGEYHKAIQYQEKALNIILQFPDQVYENTIYCQLGYNYAYVGEYSQAEKYFLKSIKIAASLQKEIKHAQWQVTLFERLSNPYLGLEGVLLEGKSSKALEISDTRRSRVLSSLLTQKLSLQELQDSSFKFLSFQEIEKLAKQLDTTFIIYSLGWRIKKPMPIYVWIISSEKREAQSIPLPLSYEVVEELDQIFNHFPYQIGSKRPIRGAQLPGKLFNEKLASWYDFLIHPLEPHLPLPRSGKTLTFIPDSFLAHLPFGSLYNTQTNKYLIENYPISVAPSLQVLSLLNQLPKESLDQALLMGHPTTSLKEYNNLEKSEDEVRKIIAPFMQALDIKVFTQQEATVENIFKHASHAQFIHIAAHGVAGQKPPHDPYSVFEGFFRLAPDEKYPSGDLHAKDVNALALKADLVFMSACHLGRGNLKQEGSLGPIWSFLGAGAKSTIASYWPLPEGDMTVKMVDAFYRHYLGIGVPKLNKARALQQAVFMAMETERDKPRQWGAFFLSGLIE